VDVIQEYALGETSLAAHGNFSPRARQAASGEPSWRDLDLRQVGKLGASGRAVRTTATSSQIFLSLNSGRGAASARRRSTSGDSAWVQCLLLLCAPLVSETRAVP
jgi:hypothetical protein